MVKEEKNTNNRNKQGTNSVSGMDGILSSLSTQLVKFLQVSKFDFEKGDITQLQKNFTDYLLNNNGLLANSINIPWSLGSRLGLSRETLKNNTDMLEQIPQDLKEPSLDAIKEIMITKFRDSGAFSRDLNAIVAMIDGVQTFTDFRGIIDRISSYPFTKKQELFLSNLTITNQEILMNIIDKNDTILSKTDLIAITSGNFQERPLNAKGIFNHVITKELIDKYFESYEFQNRIVNQMSNSFKVPTIKDTLEGYDRGLESLKKVDTNLESTIQSLGDDEKAKDSAKLKAFISSIQKKDPAYGSVMKTLLDESFDFSKLDVSQQQIVADYLKNQFISTKRKEIFDKYMGLDVKKFQKFADDVFDLKKETIMMPNGETITFKNKGFKGGPLPISSISDLLDQEYFPLVFEANENEILNQVLANKKDYFEIKGQKIHPSYKVAIQFSGNKKGTSLPSTKVEGYLNKTELGSYALYSEPVTVPSNTRRKLYDIAREQEKNMNVEVLSKSQFLSGDYISSLMFAWASMSYSETTEVTPEQIKDSISEVNEKVLDKVYTDKTRNLEPEEVKDNVETKSKFLKKWNEFKGQSVEPKVGSSFFYRLMDSALPGGGSHRVEYGIEGIDPVKNTRTIRAKGADFDLKSDFVKEFPMSVETLEMLTRGASSKVYKAANFDMIGFTKNNGFEVEEDFKNELKRFQGYNFDGKNCLDAQGKEIAYFGKVVKNFVKNEEKNSFDAKENLISYKTKFSKDFVDVSFVETFDPEKVVHIKQMSYPAFYLFAMEKGLAGYTEKDFQHLTGTDKDSKDKKKKDKKNKESGGFKLKFFSIADFSNFFKMTSEKIEGYFKDKQEKRSNDLQSSLVYDLGVYKKLKRLPFVGKAFEDIDNKFESDLDGDIIKAINKEKTETFEAKASYDAGGACKDIADLLEAHSGPGDKQYEIAGGLLFTIEKGGLFQRDLKEFAGKGQRVKSLLGPKYQEQYLREVRLKLNDAKNSSTNRDELLNNAIKYEIAFIVDKIRNNQDLKRTYSSQFANTLEGAYRAMPSPTNINKTFEESSGLSFSDAYGEFWGELTNKHRIEKAIGFLKVLGKNASNPEECYKFYGCVLAGITSGLFKNEVLFEGKNEIIGMCRRYGFPIGYLLNDHNSPEKVKRIIEVILNQHNASESNPSKKISNTFEENKRSSEAVDYQKYADEPHNKFASNFNAWWNQNGMFNGTVISDVLSLASFQGTGKTTTSIFSILSDDKVSTSDKALFKELLSNMGETDLDSNLGTGTQANKNFFKRGVFNISNTVVAQDMFSLNQGAFQARNDISVDTMKTFWSDVNENMKNIQGMKLDSTATEFIIKKFYSWFNSSLFNSQQSRTLVYFIKHAKTLKEQGDGKKAKEYLKTIIYSEAELGRQGGFPGEIMNCLEQFYEFLYANLDNITSDTIKSVIGEEYLEFFDVKTSTSKVEKHINTINARKSQIGKGGVINLGESEDSVDDGIYSIAA